MKNPTIRELLVAALKAGGFDGLYNDCDSECSCLLDSLGPCDAPSLDCRAGYKISCPGPGRCSAGGCSEDGFHIVSQKPEMP